MKTNQHVAVFGQTGSGKTYFSKWLLRQYPKYICYDIEGEYLKGDFGKVVYNLNQLKEAVQKYDHIVYYPPGTAEKDIEEFCKYCFENLAGANVFLYFGEISTWTTASSCPYWLQQLYARGRKRGIGLGSDSQKTALVAKNIISQSRHVFLFYEYEPNAIEYLEKMVCRGIGEKLKALKEREFYYFSRGVLIKCSPIA